MIRRYHFREPFWLSLSMRTLVSTRIDSCVHLGSCPTLSYLWLEDGVTLATGAAPTINLAVGTHLLVLAVMEDNLVQGSDEVIGCQ
jgi:hypothetical protein